MTDFASLQHQFANHLRNPDHNPAPEGIEERRLGIYRDLIFNNLEGFLSSGFPVLKSLYAEADWKRLVRSFIVSHRAHTPYFLEISEEFLLFLQKNHVPTPTEPAFLLELAHYEWVELALDVSAEELPLNRTENLMDQVPEVSPLVCPLSYRFPVHRISIDDQPSAPPEALTHLLVYRNRDDQVRFMEVNALTLRLLQLLQDGMTGHAALEHLAQEMSYPDVTALLEMGHQLLQQLQRNDILL